MADVHRARDLLLEREVAVKLLRPRPDDTVAASRFRTEARTLAAVSDPHVITILDVSRPEEPRPFLVMELIDGPSLGERLLETGPMDEAMVRALGIQLARGLGAAHQRGIIHRDVKPGNILLKGDDTAILTDFGISRLADDDSQHTAAGHVIGSPAYLAPEQVSGAQPTPAVDIYALGLVLLECYTGSRVYPGPPVEAAMARLVAAPAIPVSLPSDLRDLLVAMTAAEPAERPTAEQVAAALDPLNGQTVSAVAAPVPDVIDVHTEEFRLPVADTAVATGATRVTGVTGVPVTSPEPPATQTKRRRTALTVLAAGAAALAFVLVGPLGLAADKDADTGTDRPTAPVTPVADPPATTATPEVTPTPVVETSATAGDGSGGGGGGSQTGPADKPAKVTPEKAKEPAEQGKGPSTRTGPGSGKGSGKGGR